MQGLGLFPLPEDECGIESRLVHDILASFVLDVCALDLVAEHLICGVHGASEDELAEVCRTQHSQVVQHVPRGHREIAANGVAFG